MIPITVLCTVKRITYPLDDTDLNSYDLSLNIKDIPMRKEPTLYINGKKQSITPEQSQMMLADYLRYEKCLTGTKVVCAEGDCGACSVLRYFPHNKNKRFLAINSCITPVATLDGSSIVTIDQIQDNENLHETQRAMIDCHGSQCGFCTPGFVVALTGLVEKRLQAKDLKHINEKEAKNALTGNLCRCTGYTPIIEAAKNIDLKKCQSVEKRFLSSAQINELDTCMRDEITIKNEYFHFYAPTHIKGAIEFLTNHPDAKIIASATDLGVMSNKHKLTLPKLLSLHLIKELYEITLTNNQVAIGARATLEECRSFMEEHVPEFANFLNIFASPQIKNNATLIGNIANASPIGDTPAALLALNAQVELVGDKGARIVELADFFQGYRKINRQQNEIISFIKFMKPKEKTFFKVYKNSIRKDLDISAVNLAINFAGSFTIAAGGVAATPLRLKKTESFLNGKIIDQKTISDACLVFQKEFNPISDVRASASYRRIVMENLFKSALKDISEVQNG